MKPPARTRESGIELSIRSIRFSKWNVIFLFANAAIGYDLRPVETSESIIAFGLFTVVSIGFGLGILVYFFLHNSHMLLVGRIGSVLIMTALLAQLFAPPSMMQEFVALYAFGAGLCTGYAFYMFFFFLNSTERLLNVLIVQLYFAVFISIFWNNEDVKAFLANVVVYVAAAFFVLCLFITKQGIVPKRQTPKERGCDTDEHCCPIGKKGITVLLYVFIIFTVVDSINKFIVYKDTSVDYHAYGIGVLISIIIAIVIKLVFGRSVLYMWKIFLIGSLLSMAVLALDGILNLRAGSFLFGIAHALGYIAIFFLIGGSAQMTGCLRMFRWFCMVVFLLSFILDPMIANIFSRFNQSNNFVALILMVVIVCITFSRYSILYTRIFETSWINDLNLIKRRPKSTEEAEIKVEADIAEGLGLTPREKQIFSFMLTDMSVKQIMIELEISKGTLNFHTANLYRKLEIQSRTELLVKYGVHPE